MFTVKHTNPNFYETLYSCREVCYHPHDDVAGPEAIFLYGGDAAMETLQFGTVYVMNENGATVSKYDLGSPAQPPDGLGGYAAQAQVKVQYPA